jgi:hypothetical protein
MELRERTSPNTHLRQSRVRPSLLLHFPSNIRLHIARMTRLITSPLIPLQPPTSSSSQMFEQSIPPNRSSSWFHSGGHNQMEASAPSSEEWLMALWNASGSFCHACPYLSNRLSSSAASQDKNVHIINSYGWMKWYDVFPEYVPALLTWIGCQLPDLPATRTRTSRAIRDLPSCSSIISINGVSRRRIRGAGDRIASFCCSCSLLL